MSEDEHPQHSEDEPVETPESVDPQPPSAAPTPAPFSPDTLRRGLQDGAPRRPEGDDALARREEWFRKRHGGEGEEGEK